MKTSSLNGFLTWKEVLNSTAKTVTILSYGYEERSVFGRHFEPFAQKREFSFEIHRFGKDDGYLYHPWLILAENEVDLTYDLCSDGTIILDDPDLFTRN